MTINFVTGKWSLEFFYYWGWDMTTLLLAEPSKAAWLDRIYAWVFEESSCQLAPMFIILPYLSHRKNYIPDIWKGSCIIPIPKKICNFFELFETSHSNINYNEVVWRYFVECYANSCSPSRTFLVHIPTRSEHCGCYSCCFRTHW